MDSNETHLPDYLFVSPEQLGRDTPVQVVVAGDMADVARCFANDILDEIIAAQQAGRAATLIVPVGPVDQFPILAGLINDRRIDCRDVCLINMDEYLTDNDACVDRAHPLSFRGFMDRKFYDLVDADLAPRVENRVFPDPAEVGAVPRAIERRGGVHACFGGIGINGHIAFNEPPGMGDACDNEAFAALPTRVLNLTCETRTINSNTVGGEISIIPHRAITVGMREILAAQRLRFYCNRPWQSAVIRRVLHGPVTARCPASFLRTHGDAKLTVADYVAAVPDIRLR
jgi:glucosamine-6-phosphate deaminase